MVDLLRAVAVVLAIVASARVRSRVGIACACVLIYAIAADLASVVASTDRAPASTDAAFGVLFLGPSAFPGRGDGVLPLSGIIGAHPFAVRFVTALFATWAFVDAHRRSSRLRPESDEARRIDAMARPYLGVALLDATQLVLVATFYVLSRS